MRLPVKHYEARPAKWGGAIQCVAAAMIGLLIGLLLSGAIIILAK